MAESYSVEAVLKATGVSQFGKAFRDAAQSVEGVDKSSKNAGLSIGQLIKTAAGIAATVGIFRTLRSAVSKAFDRIDTMEQFERVMTTLTGSSSKANEVLATVNDTVKGTAYGLDIGAKAVQGFVTSAMDVDDATMTFSAWADAVAFYGDGTNATLGSVTDALAKATAKGKIQMDTMNRLAEAGIPAMQIYADATSKSVEEVAEMMSKGEIKADKFHEVMNTAMSDGTKNFKSIAGAAKEAGASWTGSFDNMRAAVARGVTNIIQSIDKMLTDNGLPDMRQMVANFGKGFEKALTGIADIIPPVVEKIKNIYNALKPWIPTLKVLTAGIGAFIVAMSTMNTSVSIGTAAWKAFNKVLKMNPWIAAISAIIGVISALVYLWKTSDKFRNTVTNAFNTLKELVMPIVQTVVDFIMGIWGQLVLWWQQNNEMILQAAQNVWNVISTVITTVMNVIWGIMQALWPVIQFLIIDTWNAIKGVIQGAIGVITGIIQAFSALFTGNWSALWDAIKQIVSSGVKLVWNLIQLWFVGKILKAGKALFSGLRSIITSLWNAVKSLFTNGVNTARSVVTSGFNAVRSVISSVMNGVRSIISSIWNGIRGTTTSVVNAIRNTIRNIFNSLRGIVSNAFNGVKNAVRSGINGAKNIITGMFSTFKNAGKNIVTSIADGIKGAIGTVTDAIGNVTKKIRDFLPFSPAKEGALRDIMKIQIPQSIAESIDKGRNVAVRSMGRLSDAINGEMPTVDIAGQVANSNARINSSINHEMNHSNSNIENLLKDALNRKQVIVLDTGALVGETTNQYDESLGDNSRTKRRWSL